MSSQPATNNNPVASTETTPTTTNTTPTDTNKNIFAASSSPHIQIYDSGAGKNVLQATVKKLEAAKFDVENLNDSQFQYDQTYIWYHKENLELAQQIAGLLSDRKVTLKESKTYGLFDILIWLGKA